MRVFWIFLLMLVESPSFAEVPATVFRDYKASDLCADVAEDMSAGRFDVLRESFDKTKFLNEAVPSSLKAIIRLMTMQKMADHMDEAFFPSMVGVDRAWYFEMRPDNMGHKVCQLSARSGTGIMAFDLIIEEHEKRLAIIDFFDYVAGSLRSTQLRQRLILSMPEDSWEKSRNWRDTGPTLDDSERARVQQFFVAVTRQDLPSVRELYDLLPLSMQADFNVLSAYAMVLSPDDPEYKVVLGQLAQQVSDINQLALLMADFYVAQGDKQKIRKLIPVLSRQIAGSAPGRGAVLGLALSLGDEDLLRGLLSDALLGADGDQELYWLVVDESVKSKDYKTALLALDVLKKRFYLDFSSVSHSSNTSEAFKRFIASAEFKAWQAKGR